MSAFDAFNSPDTPHGNIVFNWRNRPLEDLLPYSRGYRWAGYQLATKLAETTSHADYDGYPIFFLYRHAIELALKAVILKGAGLASLEADENSAPRPDLSFIWRQHSLEILFGVARGILVELEPVLPGGSAFLDDQHASIRDLNAVDAGSYTFRYPIDTKARPSFPRHTVLNVLVFAERIDALHQALEGAHTHLSVALDASAEVKYHIQELLRTL